ncbi:MAG: winged helix-turn-helix transcriptional regulator [Rhodospirillaceae bacterium]|nr:winged helix-turn-helix transcriptional regulator [Rhodospirillaceae bacterium]
MESTQAISALSALAQDTRLEVFRLLMCQLPNAVSAGDLATKFKVPASTMSAHLAILARAGLIQSQRRGRTISYSAKQDGIRDLLAFLVKDCCNGRPNDCNMLLAAALGQRCA